MTFDPKRMLALAAPLLCLAPLAHATALPAIAEARTSVTMQTCAGACSGAPFEYRENLWRSHGDGDSPVSSAGFYPTPNGPTQYAYANANLSASQLHVVSSGQAGQGYTRLYAAVAASIGDTFMVSGGGASRLSVDTSGTVGLYDNPSDFYASVTLFLLTPGSLDAFSRGDYANFVPLASVSQAVGGVAWGSPAGLALPGTVELVFDAPATPFEWSVQFASFYTLTGNQGVSFDLGHTLTAHFDAPQGALVSSASGYLPSATGWVPTPAVPEPATMALMLAGLGLVLARGRRLARA